MNDLEYLINRYLDVSATEEEMAALNELLRADFQARRIFAEHLNLDSALAAAAAGWPGKQAAVEDIVTLNQRAIFSNAMAYGLIAIASAIIFLTASWLWLGGPSSIQTGANPNIVPTENQQPDHAHMAVLIDAASARFADGLAPQNGYLQSGNYWLLQGMAHVRFALGAEMIFTAPAKWSVLDAMHVRLDYGKVRVMAPPSSKGFSIVTPNAEYVDWGTEFGLEVDQLGKASDLYVFDGQVNVTDHTSAKVVDEVFEGQSVRHSQGSAGPAPNKDSEVFPTPGDIGRLRWASQRAERLDDPGLIAWFPFERSDDELRLDNAVGVQTVSAGRINGPRWSTGRWSGKQALRFDSVNDFVELDISGKYQELTVAAWLKVDRYEHELTAILNSNGAYRGALHLQMNRLGLPRGGLVDWRRINERWIGNPVPTGKWTHLVSVLSLPQRSHVMYVNGSPVLQSGLAQGEVGLQPGLCRLGNWFAAAEYISDPRSIRPFCGLVDELFIWNRALSANEVTNLTTSGRPDRSWRPENPPLMVPMTNDK